MKRVTDNQSTRYVLNVYRRKPGQSDNIRHVNCDTLQQMVIQLGRQMNERDVHKVEVMAVLEVFVAD